MKNIFNKTMLILGFAAMPVLSAVPASAATPFGVPPLEKVMIVIFENTDYSKALAQPFFAQLTKQGALLSNLYAEVHPSQANYIGLISGSLHGVSGDGSQDVDANNVVDLLEAKGKTWKVYAEAYPGNCFKGAQASTYVRKHNPFISFRNIQNNSNRCKNIVDASQLDLDTQAGQLPDYSFYIPDLNNDGHDTNVGYADKWFAKSFGPRLKDPKFVDHLTLFATFDESGSFGGNHIYTAVIGNFVKPGANDSTKYTHYSLLRTIEDGLGIGDLGLEDAKAAPLSGVWK